MTVRALLLLGLTALACPARDLADRWFYWSCYLTTDQQVTEFRALCDTAAQHGYNGVCWSGPEGVARWKPAQLARLEQVKTIAAEHHLELIPLLFSVGYGGSALGYDRNLAVGLPVRDAVFEVRGGEAQLVADPALAIANPGFEESTGHKVAGWRFCDGPGTITFVDRQVKHSGAASLRFENPGAKGLGPHARAMAEIAVKPHRHYRLRLWLKSAAAEPVGTLRLQVYDAAAKSRNLVASSVQPATFDWREETVELNSGTNDKLRLYVGSWGGQTGQFWLDDVSLEEVGLNNILRRDGCPLTVTAEDGTVAEEGRDYARVADLKLLDFSRRPGPKVVIPPTSRLRDGQRLRLSWYHAAPVADRQVSVCMSAPGLYEHYAATAKRLAEVLPSRKFLLSMDEIREGGTDLADQQRKLTMGEILGDCITRQQTILRQFHPACTSYIWSDMLDPGHNGHGDYFQVEGSFAGAIDHVPSDLVIACWYGSKAKESLAFFDQRGFRTLGAAYYDTADLTGSRAWLEALAGTSRAVGIMYTTWQNKYALLGPFGELVRNYGR